MLFRSVPTIGETTIRNIHQAGGKVLAVEADRTILIDADATIALADQLGLSIVSLTAEEAQRPAEAA